MKLESLYWKECVWMSITIIQLPLTLPHSFSSAETQLLPEISILLLCQQEASDMSQVHMY